MLVGFKLHHTFKVANQSIHPIIFGIFKPLKEPWQNIVKDCEENLKTINVYFFFFKIEYHKFCHNILNFQYICIHHLLL